MVRGKSLVCVLALLLGVPWTVALAGQGLPEGKPRPPANHQQASLLSVPGALDLGTIGPGEAAEGVLYLQNGGWGRLAWFIEGVEGWVPLEAGPLSGSAGREPEPLKVRVISQNEPPAGRGRQISLLLKLEWGDTRAFFRRQVPAGPLRETLRLSTPGGIREVPLQFRVTDLADGAQLRLSLTQIDFGTVRAGEQVTRRIELTNRGRAPLDWKAGLPGRKGLPVPEAPIAGRYLTFRNESLAGAGIYLSPPALRDQLSYTGPWEEEGGCPATEGEQRSLRFRFTGTGISLFLWRGPDGGPVSVFIDEQFVELIDGFAEQRERVEIPLLTGQPEGSRLLTVVSGGGRLVIEGVRIQGRPVLKGPPGWISLFPDSGTTTRETDYLTVALSTRHLQPGIYGERVLVVSSGGSAEVEAFLEVSAEPSLRLLEVHRYAAGSDHLYTTDPQAEMKRIQAKGFKYQTLAFRLFAPGTPGTTEFHRWYHPGKGDHYYAADPAGGGKSLAGYLHEGVIGHIATSRLTGTRPLYRWYNPTKGLHFYTTDQSGEGMVKKGYRFDGIAGFVR